MQIITQYLSNLNICYVILNILLLVAISLYLKEKNTEPLKRKIILLSGFIVSIFLYNYLSGALTFVFKLKYLSVRGFLTLIIAMIGITLFTMNKKIKLIYSILNYTLTILITTLTIAIIVITIGNNYQEAYFTDINNTVALIDLSFIIFIIYLIITSIVYISSYIINNHKTAKQKENKLHDIIILTDEELLSYKNNNDFYINEVECSIIFEDSNQDNIIKNYHILLKDINAKMVNGFTLKENKLLKSICNKLQIYDLNNINIKNLNILSQVTVEEYNFLKKII